MRNPANDRVQFGPFVVDLHTHEVRKDGTRIRLIGQPFDILSVLLSKPGELVTREELRMRLWPGDTFVDFDHGLNAAVNKLRETLCDSADNPRFVETLPRRGYRFIAKVEQLAVSEAPVSSSSILKTETDSAANFVAAKSPPLAKSEPVSDLVRKAGMPWASQRVKLWLSPFAVAAV